MLLYIPVTHITRTALFSAVGSGVTHRHINTACQIPTRAEKYSTTLCRMYFNSVYEDLCSPTGTESFSSKKMFQNNSNEKKRRTEFPEEPRPGKHPRSCSEGSFFLNPSDTSSILTQTVNNYTVDLSELELVDSQRLAANIPTETVFQFVPLDKPLKKESESASPKERIDNFSASKHQCNVGPSCETDFGGNNAHVFTSPSALSPRFDEKNAHQDNPSSTFSERSQHSVSNSAQSKSAKVNYYTLDSLESKSVPAERTGYECEKDASRLVVSTEYEDGDENECDNCTTVESSSVSCRSRRGGNMSTSRSVARNEVSVDRSWAQKHSSTSYRNRHRSYSRSSVSERSNGWVSAAPASSSYEKVVPYNDNSSSGASYRSAVSRRSEGRRNEHVTSKHQHRRSRSKERHEHLHTGRYHQVSDRYSRDHSPSRRSSYGAESSSRSSAHPARRSRSSSRNTHTARSGWSVARPSSSASYGPSSRVCAYRGTYSEPERLLEDLPLEWWERSNDCKEAKARHTDRIDHICDSREDLVLKTTLWKENTVLEPNMFQYSTPYGVEHHTLWSIHELTHPEIVAYVDNWLLSHMPHVRRWQYDDNSGERSINLFHVHIFIETVPYSFTPRAGMLYLPPHAQLVDVESKDDL